MLYCISCWLVPEVGDFIAVLDPPYGDTGIEKGTVGRVVEVEGQGPFRKRFLVAFTGETASPKVQHQFYAHQIQAAGITASAERKNLLVSKRHSNVAVRSLILLVPECPCKCRQQTVSSPVSTTRWWASFLWYVAEGLACTGRSSHSRCTGHCPKGAVRLMLNNALDQTKVLL